MNGDMTARCEGGLINIRVGAIIIKDGKILMVGNENSDYLYSVGGRLKFGETAEQAVIREVLEETGVQMEIDRLGFIHENYFIGDTIAKAGKTVYEISFFFYMKVPGDFAPVCTSIADSQGREFLKWVTPDEGKKMYPEFFRTELYDPQPGVRHFVTDDRPKR